MSGNHPKKILIIKAIDVYDMKNIVIGESPNDFLNTAVKFKQVRKDPPTKNIIKQINFKLLFFKMLKKPSSAVDLESVLFSESMNKVIIKEKTAAMDAIIKK